MKLCVLKFVVCSVVVFFCMCLLRMLVSVIVLLVLVIVLVKVRFSLCVVFVMSILWLVSNLVVELCLGMLSFCGNRFEYGDWCVG